MRRRAITTFATIGCAVAAACSDGSSSQSEDETTPVTNMTACEVDGECPTMQSCVAGICLPPCAALEHPGAVITAACGHAVVGQCHPGTLEIRCIVAENRYVTSTCSSVEPVPEACNGLDDDCDGLTDDEDICHREAEDCVAQYEYCDSKDNDCDGETDEGYPELGMPCTVGIGACTRDGTTICAPDQHRTACGVVPGDATDETCNGVDDNCDGSTDEGIGPFVDGSSTGDCRLTITVCTNGGIAIREQGVEPTAERCDLHDNDCDGETDEDYVDALGASCTNGTGECMNEGRIVCDSDGNTRCDASKGIVSDERCNGLDDDCDGATDEDWNEDLGSSCAVGNGDCERHGFIICSDDGLTTCSATPGDVATRERCDDRDNDCDGYVDEDPFTELCTAPPASGCLDDGLTYRSYGPLGLCIAGECDYTGSMVDIPCDDGNPCTTNVCPDATCVYAPIACDDANPCTLADRCEDGECVADPRTCDTPPDAVCVDTSIRIFDAGGVCVDGDCGYTFEDTPCSAPDHSAATCAGAECGFECEDGYEICGEECCLIPWIPISVPGAPSPRYLHTAVWTGSEMII